MTREAAIRALLSEYEQQRARNREALAKRQQQAAQADPGIHGLLARRQDLLESRTRQAFADPGRAMEISVLLEKELAQLSDLLRAALIRQGLPEDHLQPSFRCHICQDTGYVGEPIRRMCACLETALLKALYQEEGLQALEKENFDCFDAAIFSDEPLPGKAFSQRTYMERLGKLLTQWADDFPQVKTPNLLFTGKSGLGKSYLMNCIAQRVLSRGRTVTRISAYRLFEKMRAVHFGGSYEQQLGPLLDVELLLIDDLGAEPMVENVTIVQLFNLLNERLVQGKGMVISTNFSLEELAQAYSERVASRLMDARTTMRIPFYGADVRQSRG